jgi:hypothetical protein
MAKFRRSRRWSFADGQVLGISRRADHVPLHHATFHELGIEVLGNARLCISAGAINKVAALNRVPQSGSGFLC